MKVALISFEFAGTRGGGGIGTYVRNAANMLASGGHQAHVFTGSPPAGHETPAPGVTIHAVNSPREFFAQAVVPPFLAEHRRQAFDVIDGPEYGCDAQFAARAAPEVALVVHLHGPSFTIFESNARNVPWKSRLRFRLGALRRLRWPTNPWHYDPLRDPERLHAVEADEIIANSQATADRCVAAWGLPTGRLSVVPYPFDASSTLAAIGPVRETKQVLFLGKLEVRKGVLDIARAIPRVLRKHPDVRFRFVGRILPHPADKRPLDEHILKLAGPSAARSIDIVDGIPYDQIPLELERAQICAFPSDWEASGFVCMEGMAAGRPVIGSTSGGMAEIIQTSSNGRLVEPCNPAQLAQVICELLESPKACLDMGRAARASIHARFAAAKILPRQVAAYQRAITQARIRRLGRVESHA